MKLSEFKIGITFWVDGKDGAKPYRCTDIGTRVITGIALNHDEDPSWYNGPPYAVVEYVFDEYEQDGCYQTPISPLEESDS